MGNTIVSAPFNDLGFFWESTIELFREIEISCDIHTEQKVTERIRRHRSMVVSAPVVSALLNDLGFFCESTIELFREIEISCDIHTEQKVTERIRRHRNKVVSI